MNFIYDYPSAINLSNVLPWVSYSTGELNNNKNHKSSVLKETILLKSVGGMSKSLGTLVAQW